MMDEIDRQIAEIERQAAATGRRTDPNVADNAIMRRDVIRRMDAGEITLRQAQAIIKDIGRQAKREGKPTLYGVCEEGGAL